MLAAMAAEGAKELNKLQILYSLSYLPPLYDKFQIQTNSSKHTNISSYIILFYHVIELGVGFFISKNIFDILFKTM